MELVSPGGSRHTSMPGDQLRSDQPQSRDKGFVVAVGLGLALTPIHNLWLTNLFTLSNGMTVIHVPALANVLWILGALFYVTMRWCREDDWRDWLGDWKILVPLLIIVAFMGVSGLLNGVTPGEKVAPFLLGVSFLGMYAVGRKLGVALFRWLIPFVVLGAVIAVVAGLLNPGTPADKNISMITNYAASAGFLIVGATLNQGRWQWLLVLVALVGVFFVGATEAVFVVAVLGVVVIARSDTGKPFWITAGILAVLVVLWLSLGYLTRLYEGNGNLRVSLEVMTNERSLGDLSGNDTTMRKLTSGRWEVILRSLRDVRFFGHGYSQSTVSGQIVHNTPLIIVYQIGWIPALAWLSVTIYCLVKTRWKYAWVMILAASVWDHWLWTQFAPYWWALAGVSMTSTVKRDLIFRNGR